MLQYKTVMKVTIEVDEIIMNIGGVIYSLQKNLSSKQDT